MRSSRSAQTSIAKHMSIYQHCPRCATPLHTEHQGGFDRRVCKAEGCDFVFWDNPTQVVAAVVEHEGKLLLARNVAWPVGTYALIDRKSDGQGKRVSVRVE